MLVARAIEVVIPLIFVGILLLIGVRFARGTDRPEEKQGWLYSSAMWQVLGRVFLAIGVYLFLTRFFR